MKGRRGDNKYSDGVQAAIAEGMAKNQEIRLPEADYKQLHPKRSPMKAIRAMCLDCMGGQHSMVTKCTSVGCSLWAFRSGVHPYTSGKRSKK